MCEQNGFETVLNTGPRRDSNQGQAGRQEGRKNQANINGEAPKFVTSTRS